MGYSTTKAGPGRVHKQGYSKRRERAKRWQEQWDAQQKLQAATRADLKVVTPGPVANLFRKLKRRMRGNR